MSIADILGFLGTVVAAGALGCAAMEAMMWTISRAGWARGSMVVALGSLFTRARGNAFRVGAIIHGVSAVIFATGYTLLMMQVGITALPMSLALGLGIGTVHGILVSLGLVWVVADHHPLEEFKEADLAIGLSHLAGHVVFGGVVGFVAGIGPV